MHPNNPNIALVATSNNNYTVMKTTDGGVTWTPTGLKGIQTRDIVFDTYTPNVVYAATLGGGIQKSVDSGDTWTTTTSGLSSQWAKAIVIDPNENSRLFAAIGPWSSRQDIYTSNDGGITWQHFVGPPTSTGTYGLAIDNHGILHAATWQNGVWSCETTDANLSGIVRDTSANALSDVLITVTTQTGTTVATTMSIADGTYQVPHLLLGTYLIYASKADFLFNPYPLTVILELNRTGQNILGNLSTCILPNGIDGVNALGNMCRIPTAEPFLDLPFAYSDFVISANAREGLFPGLVTAWVDHDRQGGKIRTWGTNQSTSVGSMCSSSDPINLCYDQHEGADFALLAGTHVKPAAPGVVVEVCNNTPCGRSTSYGRYVLIDHENGYATLYAHLQSINVVVGDRFYPNTSFAPLGTSGRSGGYPLSETYWAPHLHFGLFFDLDNSGTWTEWVEEVDPYGWKPPNNTSDPMGRPNIYMWKYPINVSYCYNPSTETQTAQFDNLTASFPPGSLTSDTTVTLGIGSLPGILLEALRSASQPFFLSIIQWLQTGSDQLAIQQDSADFSTPASIIIEYEPSAIMHLVKSQLTINRWDDLSSSWIALPTTINTIAHTATAQTDSAGSFILQAPLICPADTLEPNDNYDGASLAQTNGTLVSSLFDIAQDEDWFKFDAVAGVGYNIQTTNLDTGVDTVLEIYDTDGITLLATDDNSGGGKASLLLWQAPQDGLYFARIVQASGSSFGCGATYNFAALATYRIYLPLVIR